MVGVDRFFLYAFILCIFCEVSVRQYIYVCQIYICSVEESVGYNLTFKYVSIPHNLVLKR